MADKNDDLRSLFYLLFIVPFLFIGVSLPLALERIAPNGVYGFRIRKAFESPDMWYAVNRLGGWCFIIAGVLSVLVLLKLQRQSGISEGKRLLIGFIMPLIFIVFAIITVLVLT